MDTITIGGLKYYKRTVSCTFEFHGGQIIVEACLGSPFDEFMFNTLLTFWTFDDGFVYVQALQDFLATPKKICTYAFKNTATENLEKSPRNISIEGKIDNNEKFLI